EIEVLDGIVLQAQPPQLRQLMHVEQRLPADFETGQAQDLDLAQASAQLAKRRVRRTALHEDQLPEVGQRVQQVGYLGGTVEHLDGDPRDRVIVSLVLQLALPAVLTGRERLQLLENAAHVHGFLRTARRYRNGARQ